MRPIQHMAKLFRWFGVLLVAASITAATPALAGHHQLTSQTGGTITVTYSGGGSSTGDYTIQQQGYGAYGSSNASVTCQGKITSVFSWARDGSDDDPPDQVLIAEDCTASFGGYSPSGSANNGLGFPQVGSVSQGTGYTVQSGAATIVVECTPSVSASSFYFVAGSVWYTVRAYPVLVRLTAANWWGSSYHPNVIIGTGISAGLDTGPTYQTTRNWTITGGQPFKDYYVTPNTSTPNSATLEWLTGTDLSQSSPHFYFSKWEGGGDAVVRCSAHVAVPEGALPTGGLDVTGHIGCKVDKPNSFIEVGIGDGCDHDTVSRPALANTAERS